MKRTAPFLFLLVLILWVSPKADGQQLWTGVLSSTRATNWTNAGVIGGIPNRTTVCSTLNPGATAGQINSAIAGCPSGQVVKLNAGTYNLSSGIDFAGHSNVTLRGAGADQTLLVFTNDVSCMGQSATLCISGNGLGYYGPGPPTNIVNWTSGFSQGTTSITLSAVPGLSVGMYIMLDACNSGMSGTPCGGSTVIPPDDMVICQEINTCTTESGGATPQRDHRAQREFIKVTNISGNTVTLEHGLRMPNWAALNSKQAWWGNANSYSSGNGIEDLSANAQNATAGAAVITMIFTHDSWIKGVRTLFGPNPRAHILLYQTAHVTIQDNYSYGSVSEGSGPTHYGVEEFPGYDDLIQNNIFQRRTSPYVMDGAVGTVVAYNFVINDQYSVAPTYMQASFYSHEGGNAYILWEGNFGPGFKADIVHASSNMATAFRNRFVGWEQGKTSETSPFMLYAFSRFYNAIGNVLGQSGYHNNYQAVTPSCSASTSIFMLGCGGPVNDSYTATSTMRWGNYDTVNNGVRFLGAEVPSGISKYPNPVPASQTLPSSFYLAAQPSWWPSSKPWPAIGPDIAGGNVPGVSGHVYSSPAQDCYTNVMGGPSDGVAGPLTFNAGICYGTGGGVDPPSGLSAVVK